MSNPPIILATIKGKDELTPVLQRIAADALAIGERFAIFSNALSRVDPQAQRLAAEFRKIAEAAKQALDPNQPNRFASSIDHADNAMRRLGTDTARVKQEVGALKTAFDNLKGVAGMIVGGGIEHAGVKMVEKGADIQHARVKAENAGMTKEEVQAANDRAIEEVRRRPNLTRAELIEAQQKLIAVLPDRHHMPDMLPSATDFIASMKMMNPQMDSHAVNEAVEQVTKAAELHNAAKTPEELRKYYDDYIRAQQVQGTMIRPEDYLNFARRSGGYGALLNGEFRAGVLPTLISSIGGDQLGTAMTSLQKHFAGSMDGNHAAAKEAVAMGLATEDQFHKTKTGEIKGFKSGQHIAGFERLQKDPFGWMMETVIPKLKERGITSDEAIMAELGKLAPNRTAARLLQEMYLQRESIQKHQANYAQASGLKAADKIGEDPIAAFKELKTAFGELGATLTDPVMKDIAGVLHSLAQSLANFGATIARLQKTHPELAKILGVGIPGAMVLGGGALALGALGGLVAAGPMLSGSAVALNASAGALTVAAGRLGVGGAVGSIGTAGMTGAGAAAGTAAGRAFSVALRVGAAAAGVAAAQAFVTYAVPKLTSLGYGKKEEVLDDSVEYRRKTGTLPTDPKKRNEELERIYKVLDPEYAIEIKKMDDHEAKRRPKVDRKPYVPENKEIHFPQTETERETRRAKARTEGVHVDLNPPPPPKGPFGNWWDRERQDLIDTYDRILNLPSKITEAMPNDGVQSQTPQIKTEDSIAGKAVIDLLNYLTSKSKNDTTPPDKGLGLNQGDVKTPQEVKVESKVDVKGDAEVHIAPIHVKVDGTTVIPGTTVRVPLNTGSQGAGAGSTLAGGRASRSALE